MSQNELPYVTCICPTYNRPSTGYDWLIGEAIASFLFQDYAGPKELLILNDTPGQTLACDAPGVRIVNLPSRLPSLGYKYNVMCSLAAGSLILPWEDDDISLPWRIRVSVDSLMALQEAVPGTNYFNPGAYFALPYQDGEQKQLETRVPNGVGHNCSIFTRDGWENVAGYRNVSGAQDALIDQAFKAFNSSLEYEAIPQSDWFYIYRWGVQPHHLSGVTPHDSFYKRVGEMPITTGRFEIQPKWQWDYVRLVNAALGYSVHPQIA